VDVNIDAWLGPVIDEALTQFWKVGFRPASAVMNGAVLIA
jgi:hypothetical protein